MLDRRSQMVEWRLGRFCPLVAKSITTKDARRPKASSGGRAAPTSQAAEASPTSGLPRKCLDVGRSMGWRTKADRDIVRSGDLGRAAHRV